MKKAVLLKYFMMLCAITQAQNTFKGILRNADSKEALPGATVQIKE